jgi:hypothetical protein
MAKALEEQRGQRNVEWLTFEERLGLLVDREAAERESKWLATRLKSANLRQNAAIEDLDTKAARPRLGAVRHASHFGMGGGDDAAINQHARWPRRFQ